jgi:hypothetical protein
MNIFITQYSSHASPSSDIDVLGADFLNILQNVVETPQNAQIYTTALFRMHGLNIKSFRICISVCFSLWYITVKTMWLLDLGHC